MRKAPTGGYDFARKRDYRRKVWATFRDVLKDAWTDPGSSTQRISVAESHALLMPSLEGDEIDVALNAGFREEHLHVVDQEPAVVATLKRRYPKITTYGVPVSRAFDRMAREGIRLRCANLDLCSQLCVPFAEELLRVAALGTQPCRVAGVDGGISVDFDTERYKTGVFEEFAVVAVSVLRGRESRGLTDSWTVDLSDQELDRVSTSALERVEKFFAQTPVTGPIKGKFSPFYVIHRLQQLPRMDRYRIISIFRMLGLTTKTMLTVIPPEWRSLIQLVRSESYLSTSGQTMLWSAWSIESAPRIIRRHNAANRKRLELGIPPVDYRAFNGGQP